MEREYILSGMSCKGCVNSVKEALLKVPNVVGAEVQLSPPRAVLKLSTPISTDVLQAQLAKSGKYTIVESTHNGQPKKEDEEHNQGKTCCCG